MPGDIPPEPVDIKDRIRRRMSTCSGPGCSNFAIWFGNELAKYLWNSWRSELKAQGINWVTFLKMLSGYNSLIASWAIKDELKWSELAEKLYIAIVKGSKRSDLTKFM
ncbi:hypothetical protein [Caldivirga sp.]|uniref:hypothetical protein n=1 Tax=Caldivirga sp. TaxID=2080243 RepID=UPI0025C2E178|nr:hypothetical protein [Caldivirga sp.]